MNSYKRQWINGNCLVMEVTCLNEKRQKISNFRTERVFCRSLRTTMIYSGQMSVFLIYKHVPIMPYVLDISFKSEYNYD